MKAEEINAGRLFGSDQQLLIPLWQRHYSWETSQWDELWTDVIRVRDENLEGHFVGSVVLKTMPWAGLPSEAKRYWVVDGQQRVTTLTILVCAIRDRLAQLEPDGAANEETKRSYTAQLLLNTNLSGDYRERLVLQERDRASLKPLIDGTWSGSLSSLVERAYVFFKTRVATQSKEELTALLSVILAKLSAVWVTLQDGDNAHRVFQTLNAGGKKLRQSDLVRNYFFLLLGEIGDAFYAEHWRELESDFRDAELEDYFVAWSISQGYAGGKDALFEYFHKDLRRHEDCPEEVMSYGEDLANTARYFRWIRHPEGSTLGGDASRALEDLEKWGTRPAEGLLLLLLRRYGQGKLDEKSLARSLEIVLSFVARRQLGGYEPNLHKPIFVAAARKLRSRDDLAHGDAPEYLRYILSSGVEVRTWPTDESIKAVVRTTPIYSGSRYAWAFLILERINRELFALKKHEPPILDRAKYSVEHVMPQALTTAWLADLHEWGVGDPINFHERKLHVLGNLTLTPVNSELSNRPFANKIEMLSDDWLRLNAEVVSASTWTENRIDERSAALGLRACKAFVPPLTSSELKDAELRFGELEVTSKVAANLEEKELEEVASDEEEAESAGDAAQAT